MKKILSSFLSAALVFAAAPVAFATVETAKIEFAQKAFTFNLDENFVNDISDTADSFKNRHIRAVQESNTGDQVSTVYYLADLFDRHSVENHVLHFVVRFPESNADTVLKYNLYRGEDNNWYIANLHGVSESIEDIKNNTQMEMALIRQIGVLFSHHMDEQSLAQYTESTLSDLHQTESNLITQEIDNFFKKPLSVYIGNLLEAGCSRIRIGVERRNALLARDLRPQGPDDDIRVRVQDLSQDDTDALTIADIAPYDNY